MLRIKIRGIGLLIIGKIKLFKNDIFHKWNHTTLLKTIIKVTNLNLSLSQIKIILLRQIGL